MKRQANERLTPFFILNFMKNIKLASLFIALAAMFAFMCPMTTSAQPPTTPLTRNAIIPAGLEVKGNAIQLNSQSDFDTWVAAMKDPAIAQELEWVDVDLNIKIEATSTEGCIIECFSGVFDGHFNLITLDLHTNVSDIEQGTAFIRYLNGTVQNVVFNGTVEGNGKYLTTVAQDLNAGAEVRNVHSNVNIISHINGDGTHGGIAGRCQGPAFLKNILYDGSMSSPEGTTSHCGGLVGWVKDHSTFENCLMIANMSGIQDNDCNTIGRNQGCIAGKNIFALTDKNETPACCTIVTPEQLKSGKICFALNGDQSEIVWYQTIGIDESPTLSKTSKQVYAKGELSCDGTPLGNVTYNNTGGSALSAHNYVHGECADCGKLDENFLSQQDGWFNISDGWELAHIAKYASSHPQTKIRIVNDIDMSGITYTPIIGGFAGILDGQGHTISNLIINNPNKPMQALIAAAGGCMVKNLTLDKTCRIEGGDYSAGFVGIAYGRVHITMEGLFMHGDVICNGINGAAIFACNMRQTATITMNNCGMSGNVKGTIESGLISGFLGHDMATLNGVWAVGEVTGTDNATDAVFCRPTNYVTLVNCWSVKGERNDVGKLSENAASTGELAWKLNCESAAIPTWFQNLTDGDAYPGFDSSRGVVYRTPDGYSDVNPNTINWEEPLITSAGQFSSPFSDRDTPDFGVLCDNNPYSLWHSNWQDELSAKYHWLQMELPEVMEGDMVLWIKRRMWSEDHPTRAILTGSLTADFKTEIPIATIDLGNAANGQGYTSDVWTIPSPVKFIRFTPIDCKGANFGFRTYWHAAEINLYRYGSNNGNDKPEPGEDTDLSKYDNAIYFEKAEGQSGTSMTLSLMMKNSTEVSGLQANLYMPEGVTITKVQRGKDLKARDENDEYIYSFGSSVKDGSHFLLSYSASNIPMSAGTREIAQVTINISESVKSGNYPLIVKNIEMSYGSENVKVDDIQSTLNISDYLLGDANSDGTVSVTDITCIGGYLMGDSKPINMKAADANLDGDVSVTDITLIGQMLFANTRAAIRGFIKTRLGEESADITLADGNVAAGEEITIPVTMTGQASGFQFDVYLPKGVSVKKALRGSLLKAVDDNEEYIFTYQGSPMNDGEFYRVVAYNTSNTPTSEAGEVIKLVLSTDESLVEGEYEIQLKGIECGMNGVVLSTYKETSAKLTVGGGGAAVDFVNSGNMASEIFNLFGMKVTEPIPGQTYIYKYADGSTVKRVAK